MLGDGCLDLIQHRFSAPGGPDDALRWWLCIQAGSKGAHSNVSPIAGTARYKRTRKEYSMLTPRAASVSGVARITIVGGGRGGYWPATLVPATRGVRGVRRTGRGKQ